MIAPASGVALMPADLPSVEAAPLMCAGITTFNALRNSGARPGDIVAVLGLGGLGHLGVQYAAKMGFQTVGIAAAKTRSRSPASWAHRSTSTVRHRIPRPSSSSWAGPRSILATVDQRRRDGRRPGRLGCERHAAGRRGGPVDAASLSLLLLIGMPLGQRLVFRNVDRFAGHARLQCAHRRTVDERNLSAGLASRKPTTA